MEKLINKVLNAKPVHLGLLFLLTPVIGGIISAIAYTIAYFAGYTFIISIFTLSITFIVCLYFVWVWGIAVITNKKKLAEFEINTMWFKICFWIYFSYCALSFIGSINIDALQKGLYLDNETIYTLNGLSAIYGLLVFISYGYIALFTAKIIKSLTLNQEARMSESILYALAVWAFPIGIPLLQHMLKTGTSPNLLPHKKFPWG